MKSYVYGLLFALFILSSCAEQGIQLPGMQRYTLDGVGYLSSSTDALTHLGTDVKGEGAVVFENSLGTVESSWRFSVEMTLEDQGSVTLRTHTDETFLNGVEVFFSRDGKKLNVTVTSKSSISNISNYFDAIDASKKNLVFNVDVHNGEDDGAHVLIWDAEKGTPEFDDHHPLFDSDRLNIEVRMGKGSFWNLLLDDSEVHSAYSSTDLGHDHHH